MGDVIREPPCKYCRHLRLDKNSVSGVRCLQGEISNQSGDFSCFRPGYAIPEGCYYPGVKPPPAGKWVLGWVDMVYWEVLKYVPFGYIDRQGRSYQECGVWAWMPLPELASSDKRGE